MINQIEPDNKTVQLLAKTTVNWQTVEEIALCFLLPLLNRPVKVFFEVIIFNTNNYVI